jgi:competence protein ComFC
MFLQMKNFFLDLLFPVCCVGCRVEGEWFCVNCVQKVSLNEKQFCPVCWRESAGGRVCESCSSPLTGLRVVASYKRNPELAKAVKNLKYKFSENLAQNLGELLASSFSTDKDSIIVPIPLHKKRLRWRGFNQAELLARQVAQKLNLPLEDLLIRTKNTSQQAKLSRDERLRNLSDAFEIVPNPNTQNKTVILVDDVASTGTTIIEAAQILKKAGVEEVWGLVLARG